MSFSKVVSSVAIMGTVLTVSPLSNAKVAPFHSDRLFAAMGSAVSVENQFIRRSAKADALRGLNQIRTAAVLQRRERLQKVLLSLDGIAQATLQLRPETASRIEPVVVDLAEQAIELTRDDSVVSGEADQALLKLENTVSQLVQTMSRYVEPEMSL